MFNKLAWIIFNSPNLFYKKSLSQTKCPIISFLFREVLNTSIYVNKYLKYFQTRSELTKSIYLSELY